MSSPRDQNREVLGVGIQGTVFLENGLAIKEMHDGWSPRQAERAERIHNHLVAWDIPTYDTFEVDYVNKRYKMSDLSSNRKNLVVSVQDLWQLNEQEKALWFSSVANKRNSVDVQTFLEENRATMQKLIDSKSYVRLPGMFLIVTPGNRASMIIGDYDDGVILEGSPSLSEKQIIDMTNSYFILLTEVFAKYFPDSKPFIMDEMEAFANLYISDKSSSMKLLDKYRNP